MAERNAVTETRTLKCDLSAERRAELQQQLLETTLQIERIEDLMKRMKAQHTEAIKKNKEMQSEASHVLGAGFEMLPIPCRREIDVPNKKVYIRRLDTGAIVSEAPLQQEKDRP